MSDQNNERLLRGPKGDQGDTGEQGSPGMPRGVQLGFVYLAVLVLVLTAANILFTAHYVHATQAAQQRQGELAERKICTTLGRLSVLRPPPGDPGTNPSRAFLQELHSRLSELGPDLGCNR